MSYFTSWRFHRDLGRLYGLTLRRLSETERRERILELDRWAHERERKQSGTKKGEELSTHQTREAMAWGAGARASAGVNGLLYPSPPYREGQTWPV